MLESPRKLFIEIVIPIQDQRRVNWMLYIKFNRHYYSLKCQIKPKYSTNGKINKIYWACHKVYAINFAMIFKPKIHLEFGYNRRKLVDGVFRVGVKSLPDSLTPKRT